ncbi:hypothetical protein [Flavobacterium sp. TAB 87]|uniref:hypothetical protein n=1 Tax=Flavobacterium sp. TAB 87 TaxID=1729581 RepID=UPI00076D137A|nr:hypothetical protein [Flavobacterium sp. TAB 87]KVV15226.1 hypothetical protein AP058_01328 [Flavobacterium sp. TAB 87]
MKKTFHTVLLAAVVGLTYSCKNETKEINNPKATEVVDETTEHDHGDSTSLVLNDGERWDANAETTTGVNNMIALMNSFKEKENVTAYPKLTQDLKSEFKMIFEKCTMTGEAHDQLHNFLIPIKDLLETLPSSDLAVAQKSYDELSTQLSIYKTYFK